MRTSKWVLDGYEMKKQISGGYKIVKYTHCEDTRGSVVSVKKQTIAKGLTESDAEARIYALERQVSK